MRDSEDILVVGGCGCGCDEVELHSEHQPDVMLFDEFAEPYENAIIATEKAAKDTLTLVSEKSEVIISKENLLLDDTTTIKREQRQGILDILSGINGAKEDIKSNSDTNTEAIRRDIASLQFDIEGFDLATNEEIDDMFNVLNEQ